jgi:hypothetical protein
MSAAGTSPTAESTLGQGRQVALAFRGHRHDARGGFRSQRLFHPVAHDQKGGDRLGGAAGFGDDHREGLARVHGTERRRGELRVDVIQNHQPGTLRRPGPLYGVRPANAAIQRPCAQRAAADAHHADRVVAAAHRIGVPSDVRNRFLLKRQVRETVAALFAQLLKRLQGLAGLRFGAFELRARDSIGFADHAGQQVLFVELNLHSGKLQRDFDCNVG